VVGWVAWKFPALVRRIADAGHELGSHSFWHEVIRFHSRDSLAADLARSKHLVEDLTGLPVRGFRAPGSSITPSTAWAFDVVLEQGYEYDASLCPGYSSHGGFASSFHGPHRVRCDAGDLAEVPASTLGLGSWRMCYAGGGYLRLLPYRAIRACIALENRLGRPATVYVHPREIDPDQPRMDLPLVRRFKYYVGLRSTQAKLRALLREHRFVCAGDWLAEHGDGLRTRVLDVCGRRQTACHPDPARIPPPPPREAASGAAL
jgi:polysaccharide deacetylase family protein (PEP-CTERM system associated)